ncbi:MAG: hypothetical protein C4523_10715 [Myxococcales bacterium]|jgi:hypothetical protein|nr:MAG: hypothetical protein C4523_10715 [Myxococcales bacterium]
MKLPAPIYGLPRRDWPKNVADAPNELIALVADAMVDFGPDAHSDGADVIAALVMQWVREEYLSAAYDREF